MEFDLIELLQGKFVFGFYLSFGSFACFEEFKQHFEIIHDSGYALVLAYPIFVAFQFFQQAFGPFGIVPEVGINGLLF